MAAPVQRLSEARKSNKRLDRAARLVERLFGEPLANDPQIAPSVVPSFAPHGNLLRLHGKESTQFAAHELVHSEDLARRGLVTEKDERGWRLAKGIIAGVAVEAWSTLTLGLAKPYVGYFEGRAEFARRIAAGRKAFYLGTFGSFALNGCLATGSTVGAAAVPSVTAKAVLSVSAAFFLYQNLKITQAMLFYISMRSLAHSLGSDELAFRATASREAGVAGTFFPHRFYREDINRINGTGKHP